MEALRRVAEQAAHRAARRLTPAERKQVEDEYYLSANVLKASEDKTFPGAIVASLASPWGQAVSAGDPANTYFGSYREVFARDLYETWTGLVAAGDIATARAATLFLFERQQLPDGSMPRNSLVNGKPAPDSFGTQLDEVAYPILMAQQLGLTDAALYANHIKPAANFLISRGPASDPSAGRNGRLLALDDRGRDRGPRRGGRPRARQRRHVLRRPLARRRRRLAALGEGLDGDDERAAGHASVLHPALEDGRPERRDLLQRRQRRPDARPARRDRRRLPGARAARRAPRERSGRRPVAPDRGRDDPGADREGAGWHRYNGDGYGDRVTNGRPWAPSGQGTGHVWPALSAERAEHSLATGDAAGAAALLKGMSAFASGVGLIPEQNWTGNALPPLAVRHGRTLASIGFTNGGAAGSASPLTWSAASFVRLTG